LFPVHRARRKGETPLAPHMSEGVLNRNIDCMPGIDDALAIDPSIAALFAPIRFRHCQCGWRLWAPLLG
jgi:hypothetical protein